MKQVSKALNERITGDWYFYSALSTQHSALSSQEAGGILPYSRITVIPTAVN
jgi:hypothetical protein